MDERNCWKRKSVSLFWLSFRSELVGTGWFQLEIGQTQFRVVRLEPTFPTGIWSDKLGKFPTIWVVLCSRISDQNLIGIQAVLTDSAWKTWGTDKTLDIAQMIWVASLSNASGHRRMYVQHEMRKDLPAE